MNCKCALCGSQKLTLLLQSVHCVFKHKTQRVYYASAAPDKTSTSLYCGHGGGGGGNEFLLFVLTRRPHMCRVKLLGGSPNFVLREGDSKNLLREGEKLFHLGRG